MSSKETESADTEFFMRHRFVALSLTLLVLLGGLGFATFVVRDVHRAGSSGARVRITVGEGTGFSAVLRDLEREGLLRRRWTLKLFARLTGDDRRVRRGTYEFTTGTPPADILDALVRGDVLSVRVTIPEGMTHWEIAGAFAPAGIDSVAMLEAMRDPGLRERFGIPVETLEGYLFPDTYQVPFGSGASDAVRQMVEHFALQWRRPDDRRAEDLGLTRHEVITLASIVESEARVADERPLVAAVYHNRLAKGMRLEADPTVAYAMGGYRGRLLYRDLEIDSPYNTYRRAGLPPGPICSPGRASIDAALNPDPDLRALYFVARGDGRHVFSTTLREHNAAVQQARRQRARGGGQ